MAIVSLSFPDQMIREMDQIQRSGGFAGRSELVRSAIRLLLEDSREKNALSGHMNAIIVVTHDESNEAPITKLKHEFDDIVNAKKVGSMTHEFQKEDKLKSVRLVVIE